MIKCLLIMTFFVASSQKLIFGKDVVWFLYRLAISLRNFMRALREHKKAMKGLSSNADSMMLTGQRHSEHVQEQRQDTYSQKVKEIKALRRFQQLFRKQFLAQEPKESQISCVNSSNPVPSSQPIIKKSPHFNNRLKGMFFLKRNLDLPPRPRKLSEQQQTEIEKPPIEGRTLSPQKGKTSTKSTKANFINEKKSSSGKYLQKTLVTKRPVTRIENNVSRIFNSVIFSSYVLAANGIRVFEISNLDNNTVSQHDKMTGQTYFNVYVEQGNNSEMIKTAVRKRAGWRVVQSPIVANMIWSQFYRPNVDLKLKRRRLKPTENLQVEIEQNFTETNNPPTYLVNVHKRSHNERYLFDRSGLPNLSINFRKKNVSEAVRKFDKTFYCQNNSETVNSVNPNILNAEDYNRQISKICPHQEHLYRPTIHQLNLGQPLYFYNHIPNHHSISDKKNLLFNMRALYKSRGEANVFDVIPFTIECNQTCSVEEIREQLGDQNGDLNGYWIIKPGQNSNRGRGIVVCTNIQEAVADVNSRMPTKAAPAERKATIDVPGTHMSCELLPQDCKTITNRQSYSQSNSVILQKYIQPLLYNKRKFDIRMYLLATVVKGKMRGYLYEQGYIRTCSRQFTMDSLNKFIHLTNDAIQCRSNDYGKYQQGNKLSWKKFQSWLIAEGHKDYYSHLQAQVQRLSKDILCAANGTLKKKHRKNCIETEKDEEPQQAPQERERFLSNGSNPPKTSYQKRKQMDELNEKYKIYYQVFGLDFLIGHDMRIWLIEVNTNPALTTDCSRVTNNIIPKMIDNSFAVAVEPYLKAQKQPQTLKFENKFIAIYDDEWKEGRPAQKISEASRLP